MIDRRALYVGDPQQLGAAWLPVRAQRAHGEVWALSSRTGCRMQDVSGRHLSAGEALPDRLVLAGTGVDIGETALGL
jgi:hypothetical protein